MVKVRTKEELDLMRKSGEMSAIALKKVIGSVKEGITLIELDKIAEETIKELGGTSSFKTVDNYQWTSCLTLNDEVVHGLPRDIKLQKGDVLGIDLGALYKGWHTDTAWSVIVDGESIKFLKVGEEALWKGISKAVDGNRIGDIAHAIQETVEGAGYSVVKALIGHGVGKELHEEPEVPGYGRAHTGMILKAGMTLAIEVIYTESTDQVVMEDDNWTISSADGSLGGLFEMSVIVGEKKAEVLTDWRKY